MHSARGFGAYAGVDEPRGDAGDIGGEWGAECRAGVFDGRFVRGERKAAADERKRLLLSAAEELAGVGRVHLKVGDFERTPAPFEEIVQSFALLCSEAAECGALVAFEFMASAMIGNLREARALVKSAGAPNGGLAIDIAHVVDCGVTHEEIRALPPGAVVSVELNDGLRRGSAGYDPGARRFCGEGEFDLPGFVESVRAAGYGGAVGGGGVCAPVGGAAVGGVE